MDGVEGLWVELFLPKSRGILLGMFYRPPNSSCYFDKEFVSKFEVMLDIATAEAEFQMWPFKPGNPTFSKFPI